MRTFQGPAPEEPCSHMQFIQHGCWCIGQRKKNMPCEVKHEEVWSYEASKRQKKIITINQTKFTLRLRSGELY